MKKALFFLFTLVFLSGSLPSLSFASSPENEEFRFRNGIQWGDSVETVLRLEGDAYVDEDYVTDMADLYYGNVSVSKFSAGLGYFFKDNMLVHILYELGPFLSEDYDYLLSALSSKYGPPSEADNSRFYAVMEKLYPFVSKSLSPVNWFLPDGTLISLVLAGKDQENTPYYYLMYFDESAVLNMEHLYNTDGL